MPARRRTPAVPPTSTLRSMRHRGRPAADLALPLGNIDPREARLARPLRWEDVPSAAASLLAHTRTRGLPLPEPVAA
jgi:hypothetical protein